MISGFENNSLGSREVERLLLEESGGKAHSGKESSLELHPLEGGSKDLSATHARQGGHYSSPVLTSTWPTDPDPRTSSLTHSLDTLRTRLLTLTLTPSFALRSLLMP